MRLLSRKHSSFATVTCGTRKLAVAIFAVSAITAAAAPLPAQSSPAVGMGTGVTLTEATHGTAYHAQVSAAVRSFREDQRYTTITLRVEGLTQWSSNSSSPMNCERVREPYCAGRHDDTRLLGAGGYLRMEFASSSRLHFYVIPLGLGLYHRRTRILETEGPVTLCFVNGGLVSCPDNPPWSSISYGESKMSFGLTEGLGFEFDVSRVKLGAEVRLHNLWERGGTRALALPLSLQIRF